MVRTLKREGSRVRTSPTGEVGTIYRGSGFEAVWVRKQYEVIDQNWFESPRVDLLMVVKGRLRVEFPGGNELPRILEVGDVIVLPPRTKCRAYRWPRTSRRGTVFIAVYPVRPGRSLPGRRRGGRSLSLRRTVERGFSVRDTAPHSAS